MNAPAGLDRCRSLLFVPANRLDLVPKAASARPDVLILDLEDAVAPADKGSSRDGLRELEPPNGPPLLVRVNPVGAPEHEADVELTAALPWVAGLVVPKAESPDELAAVALASRRAVVAIIESARGLTEIDAIADAGVARLAFGPLDYAADLGVPVSDALLDHPRARLAVASRAAGLPGPIDGPAATLRDEHAVVTDAERARRLGFTGKLCIHPAQVAPVHSAFAPSTRDLQWATEVLAAAPGDTGAFAFDGAMVDAPVLRLARHLLQAAER